MIFFYQGKFKKNMWLRWWKQLAFSILGLRFGHEKCNSTRWLSSFLKAIYNNKKKRFALTNIGYDKMEDKFTMMECVDYNTDIGKNIINKDDLYDFFLNSSFLVFTQLRYLVSSIILLTSFMNKIFVYLSWKYSNSFQ